eukprot:1154081-Pelagomonas_calceolata.AAC.5
MVSTNKSLLPLALKPSVTLSLKNLPGQEAAPLGLCASMPASAPGCHITFPSGTCTAGGQAAVARGVSAHLHCPHSTRCWPAYRRKYMEYKCS